MTLYLYYMISSVLKTKTVFAKSNASKGIEDKYVMIYLSTPKIM